MLGENGRSILPENQGEVAHAERVHLPVPRFEIPAEQVPEFEKFCEEKHPEVTFTLKSRFKDAGGGCSSFTHIERGKNGDGWWTGENVVDQTREVVPIFEFVHPGKIGMFICDNSTNHSCYPPGALGLLPASTRAPAASTHLAPCSQGKRTPPPGRPSLAGQRWSTAGSWRTTAPPASRSRCMSRTSPATLPWASRPPPLADSGAPSHPPGAWALWQRGGGEGGLQAESRRRTPGGAVLLQAPARRRAGLQGSAHGPGGAPRRLREPPQDAPKVSPRAQPHRAVLGGAEGVPPLEAPR